MLSLLSPVIDEVALNLQVNFSKVLREDFFFFWANQTKSDKRKQFSRGVDCWEVWRCLATTSPQPFVNFKCHISRNNLRLCRECVCVCMSVHVCPLRLSTASAGVDWWKRHADFFFCRQSPSCTVNDFSTSSGVMDNQETATSWELLLYFLLDRRRETRSPYLLTFVVLCTFFHWAQTLNVTHRGPK